MCGLLFNLNWIMIRNINLKYKNWINFKNKVNLSLEPSNNKWKILPSTPHSRVGENAICVWGVPLKIWHHMPFWIL